MLANLYVHDLVDYFHEIKPFRYLDFSQENFEFETKNRDLPLFEPGILLDPPATYDGFYEFTFMSLRARPSIRLSGSFL